MPTVVPTDSRPLSWPPIGALPRNRLASSATGGASAISPPAGDRKGRPYGGLQGVRKKNPPVTASPCQPPLGKGAMETGDADCHSRCAHWLRNDSFLQGVSARPGGGVGAPRPTECNRKCGGAGRCGHRPLRKITRSAVVIGRDDVGSGPYGGKTEIHLLSGGRGRTPPLRRGNKGGGRRIPSHGFAMPAPFRQGGHGDGGCGLPQPVCTLASQ